MNIEHRIVLDAAQPEVQCVMKMTKGDVSSHTLIISLRNGASVLHFSGYESAYLHAKKPDGTETVTSGVVYTSGSAYPDCIYITLTQLTLAAAGRVLCRAVICSADGAELYSPVIAIDVAQNLALDNDITSSSEYAALTAAKLDAQAWATGIKNGVPVSDAEDQYENSAKYHAEQAYALAQAAATLAQAAEAWAVGTVDGVPVSDDAPQYHNNAKYYAELGGES